MRLTIDLKDPNAGFFSLVDGPGWTREPVSHADAEDLRRAENPNWDSTSDRPIAFETTRHQVFECLGAVGYTSATDTSDTYFKRWCC